MKDMKRLIYITIAALFFAACDKVYINGNLDGMWQLQKVELKESTEYPQGIYYSFQRHMAQVGRYYSEGVPLRFIGNLEYNGNRLTISGLRKFLEEEKLCTREELDMFYLYTDSVTFTIEKLDKEVLIMNNGEKRYLFEKW